MQTADVWRGAVARDGGGDADERQAAFDGDAEFPFETGIAADGEAAAHARSVVGEALVVDVRGAPFELREKAAFARSGWPHVMLHAVVEGRPVYLNGRGEQATLKPGHLIIRRPDDRATIRSDRFARVITVVVAQHLLVPRYASADAVEDYFVEADNTLPQRLLYSFIVGLVDAEGAAGLKQMTIIDALGGLVSMILAQLPRRDTPLSELAASRASDLLRYLRRNFANPHLTPSMMADDLYVSVRYAHKLMQMTGRSFRKELVRIRLDAARQAFAANHRPRQTIADIAISVGFNDISQFNRHFRAAFGMTPRAARKLDEAFGYAGDGFAPLDLAGAQPGGEEVMAPRRWPDSMDRARSR